MPPMNPITIYHNSRCSKSRAALALLQEARVPVRVVEYLAEPLSESTLLALLDKLDTPPGSIVRTGEEAYDGFDINDKNLVAKKLAAHPVLMERPVVECGARALVARPPERVRDLV